MRLASKPHPEVAPSHLFLLRRGSSPPDGGRYEELNPGETEEAGDLTDWGRSSILFQFLGLRNTHLPQVPPIKQTEVPAELALHFFAGSPAAGCVKLSDFLAYDYQSPEWTEQTQHFAFEGHQPLTVITERLREHVLPRVQELAQGQEVLFVYAIS